MLLQVFYAVLHDRCSASPTGLVADVGANFGWFTVLAAKLGCRCAARDLPAGPAPSQQLVCYVEIAQLRVCC